MELILDILYIYIALYSILYLVMSLKNLDDKRFRLEERYNTTDIKNNLCLVVYSHNDCEKLEHLIRLIKAQDYDSNNFMTYVIMDNCTDTSEALLAGEPTIQSFSIKNVDTIGKDQAISILVEKLLPNKDIDAYVFLDASRFIESDFLTTVNSALMFSPVVTGATVFVGKDLNLKQKIKLIYNKYYTNFIQRSRTLLGFATCINSSILVIRKDLVEQVGCIDFQNINTELKYSLLLAKIGCKCTFSPNVKTYIHLDDFKLRIPSLSARLRLFKSCLSQLRFRQTTFNEFACSLLYPNFWVLLLLYAGILKHSYKYYFFVDFSIVAVTFIALLLGVAISFVSAKISGKEILYMFVYPLYSLSHIIKNFPPCRLFREVFGAKKRLPKNTKRLQLHALVTDGKINIPCKLDLISQNGMAKVRFTYNNKKFTTGNNLRMVDALKELILKLSDYGFTLKICQCCKNFTPKVDGTTNMVKGYCKHQFVSMASNTQLETLLWNSCEAFSSQKIGSMIEEISKMS